MLIAHDTLLRPFEETDLEVLGALRNDVALQATLLAVPRGSSSHAVRAWATPSSPDMLFFVVAALATRRALGFIQLARIDAVHGHGELGLALAPTARGQGHGSRAILLLERHAYDVLALRKVLLSVLASNDGAMRLYERVGYARAGTLRRHFYHRGAHHDVVLMEKLLA